MIKFQIISDLHIEIYDNVPSVLSYVKPSADILIIAGDVGRVHKYEQIKEFLQELCKLYKLVIYVLGNHEYYKVKRIRPKSMGEIYKDLLKIKETIPNLYILEKNSIIINDICIIGCTMWSDPKIEIQPYKVPIYNITTDMYRNMHISSVNYIKKMMTFCERKKYKLVVVTHYCPSFSVVRKRQDDMYESLYCTNLEELLNSGKIHTWIHGHTHQNSDTMFGTTRLVSNQKGKPKDNVIDFSLSKVIEI